MIKPEINLTRMAALLGGDVKGGQIIAPGPGHSAADRSLSIKPDDGAPEGFLVHSFAGDDPVACKNHVREKLGLPKSEPKQGNGKSGKAWTIISEHIYRSETGEPYLRVRKCLDDKGKKQYPQAHWNGKQWVKGKHKGPRIPYLLPQLIAAPPCAPVFFAEGELCADALTAAGFVATTVSEGAEAKWPAEATQYFRGRRVIILPDNDPPGAKHARKVERALKSVAASVRILDLAPHWPGIMPVGDDVYDWLRIDPANKDRLIDLATARPPACDGSELLTDVHAFLGRFVAYPSEHERTAHTLWIAHTHMMDAWESTPRIAFLSPEPSSGKTRALEISELLLPRPVEAVNVTAAYLFRKVGSEDGRPTILYDEIDTVFGPKAKDNEEIRGLLNAGHRRGAVAGRCVVKGKTVETEEIPAYCAVALAGLGGLPDTILSRAVIVRMRRRAPTESIESYRRREHGPEGERLRLRISQWAESIIEAATDARPTMPDGVADRDADIWEPLLAVADAAGGIWPQRARVASVALVALSKEGTPSLGIRLLADLHKIFGDAEVMSTETILHHLRGLDESPWNDIKGKPLNDRGLANRLRTYQIKSKVVRIGEQTPRGYAREDLHDAWVRYLHVGPPPHRSATSATCATDPPLCAACGQPSRPDDPILEVADGQCFGLVHRDCFDAWMAA